MACELRQGLGSSLWEQESGVLWSLRETVFSLQLLAAFSMGADSNY
jgi:hypothetical protein